MLLVWLFGPDGKRLVTTSQDGTAKVWDAENGEELMTLRGEELMTLGDHPVSVLLAGVAFSPDGKRLATTSDDEAVRVWNRESGLLLRTLRGNSSLLTGVAFSADGKRLASTSQDQTARVWDSEERQAITDPARPRRRK